MSRNAASRTSAAILFGVVASIPGAVFLLRLGTWEQASDKGPFVVLAPLLMSALSGGAWGACIGAARSAWKAAALGFLAGTTAVLCWIAAYFGFVTTSRSAVCHGIAECSWIGVAVAAIGGAWAIPPLAALAGLAVRRIARNTATPNNHMQQARHR